MVIQYGVEWTITTSELFLIIGWSMLEVAAVLSLYFYLQYYKVKPMIGYFFGMVPLITEAISMGVFEYLTR